MKNLILILISSIYCSQLIAQSEINAKVLDANTGEAIPYVNILLVGKNTGTLTNEEGKFAISLDRNTLNDSILIQHVGYLPVKTSLLDIRDNKAILLTEDIYELNEVVLLASTPDIKNIIRSTIKNKDRNYKKQDSNTLTFTRKRNIDYINKFNIEEKKITIDAIDSELLNEVAKHIPKETYSYTDFLGNIYFNSNIEDQSEAYKIDPIKTVELQSKNIDELDYFNSIFDSLLSNTSDKEYWKIKSGIIGQKINTTPTESERDSISSSDNSHELGYRFFKEDLLNKLIITDIGKESIWDFLHAPNNYEFEFDGALYIEGDEVYIINFSPKEKGLYEGKVYINSNNYAILKADFNYPKGKSDSQFKLLGISYRLANTKLSIAFEKANNTYQVKYFSYQIIHDFSFNRKIALQKLKSRFLFDKKIHEIKVDISLNTRSSQSFEYLAINRSTIGREVFDNYTEVKNLNKIYVDQFSSDLWKGYPIIQPTEKMKHYKKKSSTL